MPAARLDATTSGTKARAENSNSNSSIARMTAASGVPNVAAIPAAAPHASKIFRSDGDTWITCPIKEPSAPPVTMMGPSAPNGPPVPIAIAVERGFAIAARGDIRLCFVSTASIASGIPCPRITGDHFPRSVTTRPPAKAASIKPWPRGPTISTVANYLVSKHHSVVELVDRAEAAGLVRRIQDAGDHRVVRLVLTRSGEQILEELGALTVAELSRLAPRMREMWAGLELAGRV